MNQIDSKKPASDDVLTEDEVAEITQAYEERADHLELSSFASQTAVTDDSERWLQSLTGPGAKLLVGPRGCGKTHLMRYAYTQCMASKDLPFAIYTNLNRYYRLEPVLRSRPEAMAMFYVWVLANIYISLAQAVSDFSGGGDGAARGLIADVDRVFAESVVAAHEQQRPLTADEDDFAAQLSIDRLKAFIVSATESLGRKRCVLLLDDAALTLTPEFLAHFFDIFRALKGAKIAPKASVYPGTTEYGPNFHVDHEAASVFVWKDVTDADYLQFMEDIASKRLGVGETVEEETAKALAYAAFGVPRAYMTLLRNFNRAKQRGKGSQSAFNQSIEEFLGERRREYLSLREKKPHFASIVSAGDEVFNSLADDVAGANRASSDSSTRQLVVGIDREAFSNKPYVKRMMNLLEEAGMVYRKGVVSHGDREYERFIPHLAAVQGRRAFSSRRGSYSPKFMVEMLGRPDEKHPVRRSLSTILPQFDFDGLALDLPNCAACNAKRVEGAKYCFSCGAKLTEESTYNRLLLTSLVDVPGLTNWQREKMEASPSVPKTIGEFRALQDPGSALRTIDMVGEQRAKLIIKAVDAYLDEYLS